MEAWAVPVEVSTEDESPFVSGVLIPPLPTAGVGVPGVSTSSGTGCADAATLDSVDVVDPLDEEGAAASVAADTGAAKRLRGICPMTNASRQNPASKGERWKRDRDRIDVFMVSGSTTGGRELLGGAATSRVGLLKRGFVDDSRD